MSIPLSATWGGARWETSNSKVQGVIRLDGKESETFEMETGVKQGESLSPLLFITMMNKILRYVEHELEE